MYLKVSSPYLYFNLSMNGYHIFASQEREILVGIEGQSYWKNYSFCV